MDQQIFTQAAQALLADKVICEHTSESEYAFLQNEDNLQAIKDYLIRLDRTVRTTSDGQGYYCAYAKISEPGAKQAIRSSFNQMAKELEPIVRWMRLARESNPTGRPVTAGMLINESEMLSHIERSPELNNALNDLTKHALFKSSASEGRGRMRHILNKLAEKGYLVKLDASGSRYRATAQWSYLYDVLEFIRANEHLDEDDEATPEQQEMI